MLSFRIFVLCFAGLSFNAVLAQDYFYQHLKPFSKETPSPEQYFGFGIGEYHVRHDQIVSYFKTLDQISEKAVWMEYGKTYEQRPLGMLIVSSPENIKNLKQIQQDHLNLITNYNAEKASEVPLIVNLGYSVHGNEPSSTESSLLMAYILLASDHPDIRQILKNNVIFIDPAINPDGRERHTQWANMYRAEQLVSDKDDAEHNENWPRGRTNHYWFDLNRDWLLAIHTESRSKLTWYHQWYPNVIGDFHEMGTNSSFFFEPMKTNGSRDPIMPVENYTELNDFFAKYYIKAMDSIGSLYFTKEVFDGTYPGYGSSYGDLQGGLALLFEQASSRGHVQETQYGDMTFAFTIRNQFLSGIATLEAATAYKKRLREYQHQFFKVGMTDNKGHQAYIFSREADHTRIKAFIDKLLIHQVKVYDSKDGKSFIVPIKQPQQRMVKTFFETYSEYRDSVFYDASAWSVANFYGIKYKPSKMMPETGKQIVSINDLTSPEPPVKSDYAYLLDWRDSGTPALVYTLQKSGIHLAVTFRPFNVKTHRGTFEAPYGTIILPVAKQEMTADKIYELLAVQSKKTGAPVYSMDSGYSEKGIDLGSRHVQVFDIPKAAILVGEGTASYEAGEVWHHTDQRLQMPLVKLQTHRFKQANLNRYNTLVMVSGSYNSLDSTDVKKIQQWTGQGNTLILSGSAISWAIKNKLVKEKLVEAPKTEPGQLNRYPFAQADEILGKDGIGGALFSVDADISHPVCFGYAEDRLPVYKNNNIWLQPSQNPYSTVSKYSANPHIDGYISPGNLKDYMQKSASCIIHQLGQGRAVLFADNPVFRGSLYSTDRMLTNALFFGSLMKIPVRPAGEED